MAQNSSTSTFEYCQRLTVADCFREHKQESRRERLKDEYFARSRSKRVRTDVSEGSADELCYDKNQKSCISVKKPSHRLSRKEVGDMDSPKMTIVTKATPNQDWETPLFQSSSYEQISKFMNFHSSIKRDLKRSLNQASDSIMGTPMRL